MLCDAFRCSLLVIFTCAFFASSGAESLSDDHERHKGIRSYDNTHFPQDNNSGRDVKSLDHHGRTKSGGHDYNKEDDGCSKCKWENDDYWERDEPEEQEENDGDECDDGDDGQYRPDKTHHHDGSGSKRPTFESHPAGVYKIGPTGVYGDGVKEGVKGDKPDDFFGATNYPGSAGYPTSSYGSTPVSGSIWNTPFAGASRPGHGGVTTHTLVTTPSYGPGTGWNQGTTSARYGSTPKPSWTGEHGDTSAGNFGTTPSSIWNPGFPSSPKPGSSWNVGIAAPTGGFPASQQPGAPWSDGHDGTTGGSYGTTKPKQDWSTGFPGAPTTGSPFSRKPAQNWNSDRGFPSTQKPTPSWNVGSGAPTAGFPSSQKPVIPWSHGQDRNTGFDDKSGANWNPNQGATSIATSGCTRLDTSCNQGSHGPVKLGATPVSGDLTKNNESPSNVPSGTSIGISGTSGTHAGVGVTPSFGSTPHSGASDFEQKQHPFGFNKPIYTQAPYGTSGAGAHAGAGETPSFGNTPHGGAPGFEQKQHPFGFNKPISTQAPYGTSGAGAHAGAGVTPSFGNTPHGGAPGFEQKQHPFGFNKPINTQAPYGTSGTQTGAGVHVGTGAYAGAGVTPSFGNTPHGGAPGFEQKQHPFGFNKPINTQAPYGTSGTQTGTGAHAGTGAYAGAGVTPSFGNTPHGGAPGFEQKQHPFGFNKPISTQAPYGTSGAGAHAGAGVTPSFGNTPHGGAPGFEQKQHPFGFNKPINTQAPYGTSGTQTGAGVHVGTGTYAGAGAHAGAGVIPSFGNTPHGGAPGFDQKQHPFGFNKPISTQAPYGTSGPQTGAGVYAGAGVTPSFGSTPHDGAPGFEQKQHPFGFDKPINTQAPHGAHSGTSVTFSSGGTPGKPDFEQKAYPSGFDKSSTLSPYGNRPHDEFDHTHPSTGSNIYGPGNIPDYNKPGSRPYTPWSSSTASTFGPTKRPQSGLGSPGTVPGAHGNTFIIGKAPESPTGGNIPANTGVFQPNYGPGSTATSSASSAAHAGAGSSVWPALGTTRFHAGFPVTHPGFGITKSPFGYANTPGFSDGPHGSAGSKPITFNSTCCSTTASAGITGSFTHSTPSTHTATSSYPGFKGSFGNTRPAHETDLDRQPDSGIGAWPSKQPGDKSVITPGGHVGDNKRTWPDTTPKSGITSGRHPVTGIPFGEHSVTGSNAWPAQQPGGGSGTWPGGQVGHDNKPACSSGTCGGSTDSFSDNSGCGENYNCNGGCSGRSDNLPTTHGPCSGSSGVNKIYYPAGTGDGNVPSIANEYRPNPFPDSGAYSGVNTECGRGGTSCNRGGTGVTPEGPALWNPANPFLYGSAGDIPNRDSSRPWSGTTPKPIGQGNPFLNSNWNNSKPGDNNVNNDKNVIPLGQENTKPFNKENPFLNNKGRGDIEINTDERVIPLGGWKPEENKPFGAPSVSGNLNPPSYGEHPIGIPGSRLPGSSNHGDVNSSLQPGRVFPQSGNSGIPYPAGNGPQGNGPLQCKLGLFGCGTAGSGSYAATKGGKHPGGVHGNIGSAGNVNKGPGGLGSPGTGFPPASGNYGSGFGIGAGHPGSAGNTLAGSVSGAQAGAYAGSFSSAQASSSSFANAKSLSFSGTQAHGDNFGQANDRTWSSSGPQDQTNSWASSGASAFASSSAGSWSGSRPVDVKG